MKQLFKNLVSSMMIAGILLGTSLIAGNQVVHALDCAGKDKDTAACKLQGGVAQVGGTTNTTDLPTFIKNIINVLLFIAGAVAVIMIILGAIRYITSNGDQAGIKAAKDTIMYSIVGLVVAILAFAIVQFVVDKIK